MKFNEAKKIVEDMKKAEKSISDMVEVMGTYALNHFKQSFRDEGFTDDTLTKWRKLKREDRGRYAKMSGNRAILTRTGRLRRSLIAKRHGRYAVRITSNVNYANVHNDGLRAGRGKGFIMPKRQFVGYSGKLNRKIITKLDNEIKKIFK